jgi:hypothetical protein
LSQPKTGLGTGIVKALAKQFDSQVVTLSGPKGATVSATHATFAVERNDWKLSIDSKACKIERPPSFIGCLQIMRFAPQNAAIGTFETSDTVEIAHSGGL